MFRPYFAIIKDSFREAIASRVLWILLALTTCLLVGIASLGYREILLARLTKGDIADFGLIIERLAAADDELDVSPARRIWTQLEDETRQLILLSEKQLRGEAEGRPDSSVARNVLDALNDVMQRREMYDKVTWQLSPLSEEARQFIERGIRQLSDQEVERLNRLLFEAAFPQIVRKSPENLVQFTVLGWNFPQPFELHRDHLRERVEHALSIIMQIFIGIVFVFVGILVTAPIVPQTFSSGSLSLLLSKPISRSLLFLAKFIGGCAFILLVAGYMISGLWIIAGLRFGVWESRLLLCVPIFTFLFAVYYSVSALAGVIWKNAVVSVVLTVLLWAWLWSVGFTKVTIQAVYIKPFRIVDLIEAQDTLIGINDRNVLYAWDDSKQEWVPIFRFSDGQHDSLLLNSGSRMIGPVYDVDRDQLLALFASMGATESIGIPARFVVGRRADGWRPQLTLAAPTETRFLRCGADNEVLLLARNGVYRVDGDLIEAAEKPRLFGVELPIETGEPIIHLGPEVVPNLMGQADIDVNRDNSDIAIYSNGTLTIMRLDAVGRYAVTQTHQFGEIAERLLLAASGGTLLVCREDGRLQLFESETMEKSHEFRPEERNQPRFASAAPGGRWFAVVYQHGRIVLVDAEKGITTRRSVAGQGDVSGAKFFSNGDLFVVDRTNRVTQYDMEPLRRVKRYTPRLEMIEQVYRYVITPLYWMLPKPAELNNTMLYLLTEKQTLGQSKNMSAAQEQFNPWAPVWSNLGFIVAILTAACVYIERSEF